MKETKNLNPLFNVLREEWRNLGDKKKVFVFYMILFLIADLIFLSHPLLLGLIFNKVQGDLFSYEDFIRLAFMISLLLVITVLNWIFHSGARILEQRTGFFVSRNYKNLKIEKILELPVKWHKDNHSGNTINKIETASNSLNEFSQHSTFQILQTIINLLGSLIILSFFDLKISAFAMIYSFIVILIIIRIDKNLIIKYKDMNEINNKTSAAIFDYISNIITIITLRLKNTVKKNIDEKIMKGYPILKESTKVNEIKWAFAGISISLMTVLVMIYKSYIEFSLTGFILVGNLYILYQYLSNVGNSFYSLAWMYGEIVRASAGIENAKTIDEEYEKLEDEIKLNLPDGWKEIEIKNLDFSYDEEGKKRHIEKINLKFKKGQKIAFVGESGSGKSTVLALLRGLYNSDKGDVFVDGKLMNKGMSRLKHHITLIPQEPEIFNNTIEYNITMDLNVEKDDLWKAIDMAQFKKVVERLDKGLMTNVLEKGVSLSGGEKQRLALARGLLAGKNSEIVLLDEPTSSVDSLNEMKIHENIFREFKDKTIISSIHRLHLLDKFDYIYLFENGKIIAEGNLTEIKKNAKFSYLIRKYRVKK